MLILEAGLSQLGYPSLEDVVFINIDKINEEKSEMYDINRGWNVKFMFPIIDYHEKFSDEFPIPLFISDGLSALRIEHKLLEAKEVKKDV